jgi:hypothetical protein
MLACCHPHQVAQAHPDLAPYIVNSDHQYVQRIEFAEFLAEDGIYTRISIGIPEGD